MEENLINYQNLYVFLNKNYMNWYEHPFLNKSKLATAIGIKPTTFSNKIKRINGNKITVSDAKKLNAERVKLLKILNNE